MLGKYVAQSLLHLFLVNMIEILRHALLNSRGGLNRIIIILASSHQCDRLGLIRVSVKFIALDHGLCCSWILHSRNVVENAVYLFIYFFWDFILNAAM